MTMVCAGGQSSGRSGLRHRGWIVSLLLHGGALVLAMPGFWDLRPQLQPEPFRWDVTLRPTPAPVSSPPDPAPMQEPSPVPAATAAPAPRPRAVSRSAEPRVLERVPVVRTVQAVQRTAQAVTSMERAVVTTAAEVHERPAAESMPVVETVVAQERPAIEPALRPAEVETGPVPQQPAAAVHRELRQADVPEVQSTASAAVVPQAVMSRAASSVVEAKVHWQAEPVVRAQEPVSEPQKADLPVDRVQHRPVEARPSAQADFGWLAESLWKRIEDLKRYPLLARARRWEGKVVVEAVIRHDGAILDCHIAESSGHGLLDQDALAVLRKASPLPLKHPLGRAQVTIQVPIAYRLES